MDKQLIETKMHELEKQIKHDFHNIQLLADAMCVDKPYSETDYNKDELANECLSTVGDALLKSVLAVEFYKKHKRKGLLTDAKKNYENNSTFRRLVREEHWIDFSYNQDFFFTDKQPQEKKMPNPKHDPFVEGIVAAIYYDVNEDYEFIKKWILDVLYPLLEKYKSI